MSSITAPHARRYLIVRHLLAPPRAQGDVLSVVAKLSSLQVDPLAVTGLRNQDLVLAARVARYTPPRLEAHLYETRDLVEVYDKGLCVVPAADLPYHASEWRRAARRIAAEGGAFHEAERRYGAALLRRLDREGPLSTRELSREGRKVRAGWGTSTETRAALHVLVRTGRVLTVRREGSARWYDRAERVVPPHLLEPRIDDETSIRHRVLSRFRAMGLLGLSPTAEVFASTAKARERARVVADLVARGALVAVEVEGVRGERYLPAEDVPVLEATSRGWPRASGRRRGRENENEHATLLGPLDPLIWDRTLLEPLFGITYRWGVYTPRALRKGGYYDLPVLFGDRIVGMIEPVFSRKERALSVARLAIDATIRGSERARIERAIESAVAAHAAACGATKGSSTEDTEEHRKNR